MAHESGSTVSPTTTHDLLLQAHRVLLRVGLSLANVFAWIFIFEFFYSAAGSTGRALLATLLVYGSSQLISIVFTPIAADHLRRGTKQAMIWGAVFGASAFVILGATFAGSFSTDGVPWGIVAFGVLLGLYRALYYVPYALTVAAAHPKYKHRMVYEIFIALMPLFAALVLVEQANGSIRVLFGAAALIVLSAVPVLFLPQVRERFTWSYVYTFKQLFRRKNNALVLGAFLDGLQGAALFIVWPLAVFLFVGASYEVLGIIFTLTLLLVLLFRKLYVWLLSVFGVQRSGAVQIAFAVSGWVARIVAGSPVGVISVDAYSYATLPLRGTVIDPFIFDQVVDRASFVDEYTALKEISLASGRMAMCLVLAVLVFVVPLAIVFASALMLAGFAAGLSVALSRFGGAGSA